MKKIIKNICLFIYLLFFITVETYAQISSTPQYAPIDFTQSIWNLNANKKGRIKSETWYKNPGNDAGNAYVYMVHKNGGAWWYQEAQKKFPKSDYAENWYVKQLEKKDKALLINYHKWAFFIDKKDLKAVLGSSGSRGDTVVYFYPKYPHTVILYEQKTGSKQWIEINRKIFSSEEEENESTWKFDFLDQKVRESNLNAPVEK